MNDWDTLLIESETQLKLIESLYQDSLIKKQIPPNLQVKIKNFLENLRSILDYLAHFLHDTYTNCNRSHKIYFPFGKTEKNFEENFKKNLHNINFKFKNLIRSIQPFTQEWVDKFLKLVNEKKHRRLTPQIRKESKRIVISEGNVGISIGEGASIKIGRDATISIAGKRIYGGQEISVNSNIIYADPGLNIKKEIWVDFRFDFINESALPFLKVLFKNIKNFVIEVEDLLKNESN